MPLPARPSGWPLSAELARGRELFGRQRPASGSTQALLQELVSGNLAEQRELSEYSAADTTHVGFPRRLISSRKESGEHPQGRLLHLLCCLLIDRAQTREMHPHQLHGLE